MSKAIRPDRLSNEIMKVLQEYSNATSDDVKAAVKKSSQAVKKELLQTAPKRTGTYRKSFVVTKIEENSSKLKVAVHSKKHYRYRICWKMVTHSDKAEEQTHTHT